MLNKRAEVVRVYLPPDANCLLSVGDHCLRSRNYVNVIVAGKQAQPTGWRWMRRSALHPRRRDLGVGPQRRPGEPDVVMACCGDVPTLETLAAVDLMRQHLPQLKVRVVNVVDLMRLLPRPSTRTACPTRNRRAVHRQPAGHLRLPRLPWLIHRLAYRRHEAREHARRGYKERGTTTTPFEMVRDERPGPVPPRHRRHRRCPAWPPGPGASAS